MTTPAPWLRPESSWLRLGEQTPRLGGSGGLDLRVDRAALALVDGADLEHGVDEEAQALLRRQPAGRGVRRGDQAEILEIGHDVAHRGGRQARPASMRRRSREPTGMPVSR